MATKLTLIKRILTLIFLFNSQVFLCQHSEIQLSFSKGISTNNSKSITNMNYFNRGDFLNAKNINEQSINLRYNFSLINKYKTKLKIGTGISYTNSIYSKNIIERKYFMQLTSCRFTNDQINIPISLGVERGFYNDKLFVEFQYVLFFDIATTKNSTYSGEEKNKYEFIDYSYTLNSFDNNKLSRLISINSKFNLTKNLYLNLGLSYLRSKEISYNYTLSTRYYLTNLNTGATTSEYWHFNGLEKIYLQDNFVYLNVGLSFKFGNKKTPEKITNTN
jgi:hypothetical protein